MQDQSREDYFINLCFLCACVQIYTYKNSFHLDII